jgi:hypothetical protein
MSKDRISGINPEGMAILLAYLAMSSYPKMGQDGDIGGNRLIGFEKIPLMEETLLNNRIIPDKVSKPGSVPVVIKAIRDMFFGHPDVTF